MNSNQENVDGNIINVTVKIKNEIAQKFFGPFGYFTKIFTILDIHILVLIVGIQSFYLNFFITKYSSTPNYYYSLFGFDVFVILMMIWSILIAKKYFELQSEENLDGVDCDTSNKMIKNVVYCRLPKKFGVLPFIYISWLIYTLLLITKILILYVTQIPSLMLKDGFKTGPPIILMLIALTSIIFLVFIEAHRNSQNEYFKRLTKSWLDDLVQHTVLEIFDSITFLDLVMPERDHHASHQIKNDVRNISLFLEFLIIGLASANFLLPTINLYHLSQLSSCKKNTCKKVFLRGLSRHILIHLIRLFSVNIAYLTIRVHLSTSYDKAVSIFIIKNVLYIIMSFRNLFIEISEYFEQKKLLKGSKVIKINEVEPIELTQLEKKIRNEKKELNIDNFDEIPLNGNKTS